MDERSTMKKGIIILIAALALAVTGTASARQATVYKSCVGKSGVQFCVGSYSRAKSAAYIAVFNRGFHGHRVPWSMVGTVRALFAAPDGSMIFGIYSYSPALGNVLVARLTPILERNGWTRVRKTP